MIKKAGNKTVLDFSKNKPEEMMICLQALLDARYDLIKNGIEISIKKTIKPKSKKKKPQSA
jgi:hypothetical protein